ncbi:MULTISPECIES: hypothetical protein [unclassified Bradyrhizobium]|nr:MULTISPECIES: hypothetical protein [unclassified Bradyrhizobium]
MRNHVLSAAASRPPSSGADVALRWICGGLGLSILALAARIVSVW